VYLVCVNEIEEVLWCDVVLSAERRHKVPTDIDDRLVDVDMVLDDLLAVLGGYERVVWHDELGGHGQ